MHKTCINFTRIYIIIFVFSALAILSQQETYAANWPNGSGCGGDPTSLYGGRKCEQSCGSQRGGPDPNCASHLCCNRQWPDGSGCGGDPSGLSGGRVCKNRSASCPNGGFQDLSCASLTCCERPAKTLPPDLPTQSPAGTVQNPCPKNICNTALGPIDVTSGASFVKILFQVLLSLSGGIALLMIIISGYNMAISQGNPEKIKGAQETLTSAIIGLLFIILSVVILQIIGVDILKIPGFTK